MSIHHGHQNIVIPILTLFLVRPVWSTWAAKGLEAIGIKATDKYDEGSLLG